MHKLLNKQTWLQLCARQLPFLVSCSRAAQEYLLVVLQGILWNFGGHGPQMICKEIVIVMALGNRSLSLESTLSCHSAALDTFPLGCV